MRAEGPGAGFQPSAVHGASEPCLPAPAASAERGGLEPGGFAPSAERRRPGRDRLRCAALLPPGTEAPGEGSAGPSSRPLGCTRSSASAQDTAPGKEWIPGVPELRRPSLGVALRPSLLPPPPRPRAVWASQPEAWQGLLPAAWLGNSRCCHGTRHLLRGAASRCTPRGAPHPLLHRPAGCP